MTKDKIYEFNELAQHILHQDYLLENETPEQMFKRVADKISEAELSENRKKWSDIFYKEMVSGRMMPATPFLMNAGINNMLHSCFVVGKLDDTLESICDIDTRCAIITKMGGGLGLNISHLREEGAKIKTTGGKSTGAVSFMKKFNTTLDVVMQGRRRGAGIIVMSVYHPDIMKFITVKSDHNTINNFNISVIVDDAFMKAVENDDTIELKSPLGYVTKTVRAKEIFDKLCAGSLHHSEPGILFKGNINRDNPLLKTMGEIDSCNACGEISMYDNEACCLSSLILPSFVDANGFMDYDALSNTASIATRFLDNSIDVNNYPDQYIEKSHKHTRRLGLGIMGLHSALQLMGIPYDSKEGRTTATYIMRIITESAHKTSQDLVIKEGRSLPPAWYGSTYEERGDKVRNIAFTSGQPTGATQILAGEICGSSGIEPIFAVAYTRRVRDQLYVLVDPTFRQIAKREGWYSDALIQKIVDKNGSVQGIDEVPKRYQDLFKTSIEIGWQDHIAMQAAIQETTSNALSKTINMSSSTTLQDVYNAFMMAWKTGCKGCTIYVQGSRDSQPITIEQKKQDVEVIEESEYTKIAPTMDVAPCLRVKIPTGCGSIWVFLIYDEDCKLREVFAQPGSKGGCRGQTEGISRLISTCLKANIDPMFLVDQLHSVKCDVSSKASAKDKRIGRSCSDGIARVIKDFLGGTYVKYINPPIVDFTWTGEDLFNHEEDDNFDDVHDESFDDVKPQGNLCPECGSKLIKYDGCIQCTECTWSRCG